MNRQTIEDRVLDFMRKYDMAANCGVLVGISGGADSVCLLFILKKLAPVLGIHLHAFHLNHGIRGEEADRDQRATEEFCASLGVPLRCVREDVPSYAKQHGVSEEEAGRELRYHLLKEEAERNGCEKIAVAHHQDDAAETVLMNLFRGAGLTGLAGIRPVRDQIIRPLLCLRQEEIRAYLRDAGIAWCEDSTNASNIYGRNRIRNTILPMIRESVNERAEEHILAMSAIASEADRYFTSLVSGILLEEDKKGRQKGQIRLSTLAEQADIVRGYVIRALYEETAGKKTNLSQRHVEMILSLSGPGGGTTAELPGGFEAVQSYDMLTIRAKEEKRYTDPGTEFFIPGIREGKKVTAGGKTYEIRCFIRQMGDEFPKNLYTKWFDYDRIKGALCIRSRKEGDYFELPGGKKKQLRRFLIDAKIPEEERDQIPLLAEGNHILWVVGSRISEYYKITGETRSILEIRLCKGEENV